VTPLSRHPSNLPAMLHDFTSVTADDVTRITDDALAAADALVDQIAAGADLTYDGTLALLDEVAGLTSDAYGAGAFMGRVHPDEAVRTAGVAAEERLHKWGTDLVFRRDLYEAIAAYAATAEAASLEGTRARLLEFTMRDLRRAGHELDEVSRRRLQTMRNRLVELEVEFGRTLDEYDDGIVVDREQLDGASDEYISRLEPLEDGRYRVSLEYPDYRPFMQQVHDRELRRMLQHKFWNRAVEANRPLLEEAVALRREIAGLLGHPTWAHHAMEVKMAGSPETVARFYDSLVPGLTGMARRDLDAMATVTPDETPGGVFSWDTTYLDNIQRKRDFGVDQQEVAAYFPLEQTVDGMLDLTGDVFGLEYRRLADANTWHPDVLVYEIRNENGEAPIAIFYADLFPRKGKYGHAAAFPIVYGGRRLDGTRTIPVSAIVANFTKPGPDSPSLLQHDEALTLFHEFGHILHFSLSTIDEIRFSGFDTEWDFVEAPSQIMENWMWEPEVLQRFARHHVTGEPIPEELVKRLVAARDLNESLFTMRQVFLGKLDLGMHGADHPVDLMDVYREAYALTQLPFHDDTFFPASFGHLMGGYDAGYYGYLWSRVYGDDMFSVFADEGLTNRDVGRRYRDEVLSRGGSRDAIEHLRAFLGREPSSATFLRRLGLDG
jgi:thimet oligopeptidase